jgi:hypothetical protein
MFKVILVNIDTTASLESFRQFIIVSTCKSFIPDSYLRDFEVFPEREEGPGAIYIEAVDKVTLKRIREMTFVNAKDVLGIIYSSKSGNTQLKWRQIRRKTGKVSGAASANALVNLVESGVLTQEWVNDYLESAKNITKKKSSIKEKTNYSSETEISTNRDDSQPSSSVPSSASSSSSPSITSSSNQ